MLEKFKASFLASEPLVRIKIQQSPDEVFGVTRDSHRLHCGSCKLHFHQANLPVVRAHVERIVAKQQLVDNYAEGPPVDRRTVLAFALTPDFGRRDATNVKRMKF